jgi:hypothetical protein
VERSEASMIEGARRWSSRRRRRPGVLDDGAIGGVDGRGRSTAEQPCDRTTSKMRGLSPKIISRILDEVRMRKHTHNHTIPNTKFKLKLLQIKYQVLGFTKDKVQNML